MFSLVMSIGKKHHALMKALARLFNAIQITILHVTMWQLTQQNYIITQFQTKGVRLLTHLPQLLRAWVTKKLVW